MRCGVVSQLVKVAGREGGRGGGDQRVTPCFLCLTAPITIFSAARRMQGETAAADEASRKRKLPEEEWKSPTEEKDRSLPVA